MPSRILLRCLTGMVLMLAFLIDSKAEPDQYSRGVDWLGRYGYLSPPDPKIGKLQTKEGLEKAIREMQRFGGIKQTGKFDSETLKLMSKPRCSLPDIMGSEDRMRRRRRKRYALSGLSWKKGEITWSIHNMPRLNKNIDTKDRVRNIMMNALKAWSDVTPLKFSERSPGQADVEVSFTRTHHDDGYPFDGPGGTLAHAFFPGESEIAGDTHFDDEENWGYEDFSGGTTDLFTVAVHEFGHALGLGHSADTGSIMAPYYSGPAARDMHSYRLPRDDQQAIQQVYGPNKKNPTLPVTPPLPDLPDPLPPHRTPRPDPSVPNRCVGGFDAVANIRGDVFFFKGKFFWRRVQTALLSNAPALIKNFWFGLHDQNNIEIEKIDAAYERSDSRIVFFSGQSYWVFKDNKVLPGYPRPITEWGMKHSNDQPVTTVEAAFVWAHNGRTFLFSGKEFWGFSNGKDLERPNPDEGYPKPASLWTGAPSNPDDIITSPEGNTYFFKDNSFWIVENGKLGQDVVTSKSTAIEWMKCQPKDVPTSRPGKGDCSCGISGASEIPSVRSSQWILLTLTMAFLQTSLII
ncbi:matrix metalloproteinase-25 [Alosa sapidissima]|uniref:matrix metalloproteinase-25 n=1 Tax=Alosa sapidissima TaxID=34773 RepID=UPI001C0A2268|nr:matrix metalloproteinase-25 [Alosa sapidissima]